MTTARGADTRNALKWSRIAFIIAPLTFVSGGMVGSALFGTWPPESSIDVFLYSLEIAPVIPLALGVTALVVAVPAFRHGLAGYFAMGFLWLGVLSVVQTFRDVTRDVMVAQARQTNLAASGEPWWTYEAAHANLLLLGAGIAFLGLALRRTQLTPRAVGYAGVVLGSLLVLVTYLRFVFFVAPWAEPFPLFLLTLVWLFILGVSIYRHAAGSAEVLEPSPEPA